MADFYPFADLLRGFRQRARISQHALATRLGKHRNTVRMWERGDYLPDTSADVAEIARSLALSLSDERALLRAYSGIHLQEEGPAAHEEAERGVSAPEASPVRSASLKKGVLRGAPAEPVWLVPPALTTLLGREQEVAEACALLARPEIRLLTLLGPGGVGKTRLAQQIATVLRASFLSGVCFVELAAISGPDLVMQTIAHRFGLRENGIQPCFERVRDLLWRKHLLLLLDNVEQVVSAAPAIEKLVAACPLLKVIVTSRTVLHLQAEQILLVPPLSLP